MGTPNQFHEFVDLVARMRASQHAYVRTPHKTQKQINYVQKLEQEVDGVIAAIRRPGYGQSLDLTKKASGLS